MTRTNFYIWPEHSLSKLDYLFPSYLEVKITKPKYDLWLLASSRIKKMIRKNTDDLFPVFVHLCKYCKTQCECQLDLLPFIWLGDIPLPLPT